VQLRHGVILVEIDVLILDAAPQAFAEDVVKGAASPSTGDGSADTWRFELDLDW